MVHQMVRECALWASVMIRLGPHWYKAKLNGPGWMLAAKKHMYKWKLQLVHINLFPPIHTHMYTLVLGNSGDSTIVLLRLFWYFVYCIFGGFMDGWGAIICTNTKFNTSSFSNKSNPEGANV